MALLYIRRQSHLTQQEFSHTLRPWLGISSYQFENRAQMKFTTKNYGKIPPKNMSLRKRFDTREIQIADLKNQNEQPNQILTILPDSERDFVIPFDQEEQDKILSNKSWFVGFLINYCYSDNNTSVTTINILFMILLSPWV